MSENDRHVYDDDDYEPDYNPPYRPAICLQCGEIEDEPDIWWHWIEAHTDLNSEEAWA